MNTTTYEIEIKSLLGGVENADKLKTKMAEKDNGLVSVGTHTQLNHYFEDGDLKKLYPALNDLIEPQLQEMFKEVCEHATKFSLRTRLADKKLLFVIKASVDNTTSSNGTARMEFESEIKNKTLDELDAIILDSGFKYQAKWSRAREDFKYKGVNVTIDKNAGYGYLAEFEAIETDLGKVEEVKLQLRGLMDELGVSELPADRLERMFKFYNENWQDYYGTEKVFVIE
jgi:adenylate cyclase class IV